MNGLDVQLDFAIDPEAAPVDLDQALAQFLLKLVRSETSPETSPAEVRSRSEVTK